MRSFVTTSLALLTAFSNAIEVSNEQLSSQLEQIKVELSQTDSKTEHVGEWATCPSGVAPACAQSEWLDVTDCTCKVMPTSCPAGFAWNGNECICLPPSGGCDAGYVWEYHECRCVCEGGAQDCSDNAALETAKGYAHDANRYWFWDQCTCGCVAAPLDCSALNTDTAHYIYNSHDGACHCTPGVAGCDVHEYFDTASC